MHVILGSEMVTKLNVSREGLILLGMERTAASCVSLLSALFANVRICRLVASFGVSHQRIFHIKCYIRLHLGPALLTYSGGRLSPDCISFFLQGQHWQVFSFCASRTEALDSSLLQLSICDANFSCNHSRLCSSVHFSARVSFLTSKATTLSPI